MPSLSDKPTLNDFQKYVSKLETERGFAHQGVVEKCLLLGEEVGELFKAVRKHEKICIEKGVKYGQADEELADILIFLCSIANRLDINLENAFRAKEEKNHLRNWE